MTKPSDIPVKQLLASIHVDGETGCLFRHVKSETEYFRPHFHNYYEIFLVLHGTAHHYVNGNFFRVSRGLLIFVRDSDIHDYICDKAGFEFLNFAFTKDTFQSMVDYLGAGLDADALLNAPFPPSVRLSEPDTEKLRFQLAELNAMDSADKAVLRTKMRRRLADIFTDYFFNLPQKDNKIPFWLECAVEKMRIPKNFILGKERFFELSGRSREHATRCLAQYYGMTPSDYINELRLNYAANLLCSSNLSITDVCFESGFKNLSWFYCAFEKKFGVSPKMLRHQKE